MHQSSKSYGSLEYKNGDLGTTEKHSAATLVQPLYIMYFSLNISQASFPSFLCICIPTQRGPH